MLTSDNKMCTIAWIFNSRHIIICEHQNAHYCQLTGFLSVFYRPAFHATRLSRRWTSIRWDACY